MEEKPDFELPLPNEKLSHKFILDSLKEDLQREIPPTRICGTEAPEITLDEQFSVEAHSKKEILIPEGKKYFRIGEVAEIIGVESYVLRYWETEFKTVKPTKSNTGHRVYSRKDVETLVQVRHLLHEEKFSIKGAKRKLLEQRKETKELRIHETPNKEVLKLIQQELKELIAIAKQPA